MSQEQKVARYVRTRCHYAAGRLVGWQAGSRAGRGERELDQLASLLIWLPAHASGRVKAPQRLATTTTITAVKVTLRWFAVWNARCKSKLAADDSNTNGGARAPVALRVSERELSRFNSCSLATCVVGYLAR